MLQEEYLKFKILISEFVSPRYCRKFAEFVQEFKKYFLE